MAGILKRGDRVGIVACSNGLPETAAGSLVQTLNVLESLGLEPVCSPYLYAKDRHFSGGADRALALETLYTDRSVRAIFDVSGGDLANEVLTHLNMAAVAQNPKPFFGYSDLTTILNAIYTATGQEGWLYQIRNLADFCAAQQTANFSRTILEGEDALLRCRWRVLRGSTLEGVVVGGNIRCLLKLAGTPWFPDLRGKLLFLEANSGGAALITAFFHQLHQMGAFEKVAGVLLGTFLALEKEGGSAGNLLLEAAGHRDFPVAATPDIGHRASSNALVIGRRLHLDAEGGQAWTQEQQP